MPISECSSTANHITIARHKTDSATDDCEELEDYKSCDLNKECDRSRTLWPHIGHTQGWESGTRLSRLDSSMAELNHQPDLVRPVDYGLPAVSAVQKLTPLDMNMPRLYGVRWILCFPLDSAADKQDIYNDLKTGLAHTIAAIPWTAGAIQQETASNPEDSRIQVVDGDSGIHLKFNDLTVSEGFPSYEHLRAANFPLSELSTAQLSPLGVMPDSAVVPVMAAQANFVDGGLLLTAGAHHSACDAIVFSTVLETWAKMTSSARTGSFPNKPNFVVNDRNPIMTGLPDASLSDFPQYILSPTLPAARTDVNTHQLAATPFKMPSMIARSFRFSPPSLAALKTTAAAYSTNDALHALVWRHVTIARMSASAQEPNTVNGHGSTALLYSANIRSQTNPPLPANYVGNAIVACMTRHMSFVEMAAPAGLVSTAAAVRTSLQDLLAKPNRVALIIGLISSRPNPTDYKFAYNGFLGPDLSSTSWADLGIFDMEWGSLLGKPEVFRVPGEGADGSMIVLPRVGDGALEVVVALESRAMEALMRDEEFGRYAEIWA